MLLAGKRFHRDVQAAYVAGLLGVKPAGAVEQTVIRPSGKRLRADILLIVATEPERTQFVVEVKSTICIRDEDGRVTHPLGRDAVGFITYTPDRHMSVQFGQADRAPLAVADWAGATAAEIGTAARDYFAYCGTYELRDGEIIHSLELSLMPNWIGAELVRLVAFDGEQVRLSTPPTPVGGRSNSPP